MAPTAMSSQYENTAPALSYSVTGDGQVRVRHREFVRDIVSVGAAYAATRIEINPGNLQLFAWLQSLALSYESYIFKSLSFEFESTSSTTDRGTVMMGIDFDASDAPPSGKQELMAIHGATRSNVWSHQCCNASAKDLRKFGVQRYVRSAEPPSGSTDIKTYDVGNFYIATQGTSNSEVGELYVTYDVVLHTPQPAGPGIVYNYCSRFQSADGVSVTQPMGLAFGEVIGGLNITWKSVNSFYVNTIGSYIIEMTYDGSGLDDTDLFAFTCPFGGTVGSQSGWKANATSTSVTNTALLNVTANGCYCQLSMPGTTPNSYIFRFSPYSWSLQ